MGPFGSYRSWDTRKDIELDKGLGQKELTNDEPAVWNRKIHPVEHYSRQENPLTTGSLGFLEWPKNWPT